MLGNSSPIPINHRLNAMVILLTMAFKWWVLLQITMYPCSNGYLQYEHGYIYLLWLFHQNLASDSVDVLCDNLNSKIGNVMDDITPIKNKSVSGKPRAPWRNSQAVKIMKRECKTTERRWGKTKLQIHYDIHKEKLWAYKPDNLFSLVSLIETLIIPRQSTDWQTLQFNFLLNSALLTNAMILPRILASKLATFDQPSSPPHPAT